VGLFSKRNNGSGEQKRLFFATDLHGSTMAWGKMLSAASAYKVDALICGGDVAGKRLYPIIDQGGGNYLAEIEGRQLPFEGDDGLAEARRRIAAGGGYHTVLTADDAAALAQNKPEMDRLFVESVRDRLAEWVSIADRRLDGTGIKCYITGGNDDEPEMLEPLFERESEHVVPSEGRVVDVLGHPMISLGWSNETPWQTPRETTEERLVEMIDESVSQLNGCDDAIFNLHVPPKDSTLDSCPKLDTSQDPPVPVMAAGQVVMFGAGSSAVAQAIERYQPLIGLHGHIRESMAVRKIGRTTCINPGSEYQHGQLLGVIVVLAKDRVVDYQLTRG
jgi:uncharacterized protein